MAHEEVLKNPPPTLVPLKGIKERLIFKHYKPRELDVAREFIRRGILKGEYYFNVLLKPPERPREAWESEEEYNVWQFLRSKEIDCVCITDTAIYLIEFKDRVRNSAIGQLQNYYDLFVEQYKPTLPVKMMIVAGEDDPQVRRSAEKRGIEVVVLGIPTYMRRYFRGIPP